MKRTIERPGGDGENGERESGDHTSKKFQKGVQDMEKGVINHFYFCLNFRETKDLSNATRLTIERSLHFRSTV